jgi:hypothetical protein
MNNFHVKFLFSIIFLLGLASATISQEDTTFEALKHQSHLKEIEELKEKQLKSDNESESIRQEIGEYISVCLVEKSYYENLLVQYKASNQTSLLGEKRAEYNLDCTFPPEYTYTTPSYNVRDEHAREYIICLEAQLNSLRRQVYFSKERNKIVSTVNFYLSLIEELKIANNAIPNN